MPHRNKGPNHYKPLSKQSTSNLNAIVSFPTTPLGKRTPSGSQSVSWDKYVSLESSKVLHVTETVYSYYGVSQTCNIVGLFMSCRSPILCKPTSYYFTGIFTCDLFITKRSLYCMI
jgi:hypothetical protein